MDARTFAVNARIDKREASQPGRTNARRLGSTRPGTDVDGGMIARIALCTLTLWTASLLPNPASAQNGAHGQRPGGALLHQDLSSMAERLKLTDEQKSQIHAIRARFAADTEADWKASRDVRQRMHALWTSGDVPEKKDVVALQTEMRTHRMAMADRAVDARIEVLKVLTREQRLELAEIREERQKNRKARRQKTRERQRRGD